MKLLITLFVFLCLIQVKATDIEKRQMKLQNPETSIQVKIEYADSLLLYFRKNNPYKALEYARKMYALAIAYNDTVVIPYSLNHLGSLNRITGNFDSSLFFYNLALDFYKKRKYEDGIASIYNNKATLYKAQNRYDLAIKNYLEALDNFKNSKNKLARANLYSNFAGLYYKLENYKKAEEYWQQAERDFDGAKSHEISHAWRGFAKINLKQKEYEAAKKWITKANESDIKNNIDVFLPENTLLQMEVELMKNKKEVFQKLQNEYKARTKNFQTPDLRSKYLELTADYFYTLNNDSKTAEKYLDSSILVTDGKENPERMLDLLKKRFYLQLKNYHNLSELFIQYSVILQYERTVFELRRDRITQETDARYSLKDKEEKITILREKNKTANELIQKEKELAEQTRLQNIILWSGIGLFLVFIIYILFTNRKLKYTQTELQKNIEQKDYLFRELNHRVKNNLHIVSSFLSIESFGKTEEVQKILHTCENRIHSLGLVHEMLYKNEISENINVKSYFDKLVHVINETLINDDTEIICKTDITPVLSSNKMVLAGLIANELITNSIKYAKLPNKKLIIQITLTAENEKLKMIISDNGKGISEENMQPNSIGLKMAKGLARQLEADFKTENLQQGVQFSLLF